MGVGGLEIILVQALEEYHEGMRKFSGLFKVGDSFWGQAVWRECIENCIFQFTCNINPEKINSATDP